MSSYRASNLMRQRSALVIAAAFVLFTLTAVLNGRERAFSRVASLQTDFAAQGQSRSINETNETGRESSQTRIRYSDGDQTVEIRTRGGLEFTDDDADIRSISRDGYLMIEEQRGGMTRRVEVVPGADGTPQRSYYARGQQQPFDTEARAWLAHVLPDLIRNSGIGARARVGRILSRRGPGGVLDEISLIRSDGAKRIYFRELLNGAPQDASIRRRAARQMAREISSDGEKAELLIAIADQYLGNEGVSPDFFEAVNSISSDGERRRVLSSIMRRNLNDGDVTRALRSARAMSSDGEKAELLVHHSTVFLNHPSATAALFETINSISSDGEHARVLSALLQRHELNREMLMHTIHSAERLSSDGEKANVLLTAVRLYGDNGAALSAIADAAKTISSDGERGRVLSAIVRQGQHP